MKSLAVDVRAIDGFDELASNLRRRAKLGRRDNELAAVACEYVALLLKVERAKRPKAWQLAVKAYQARKGNGRGELARAVLTAIGPGKDDRRLAAAVTRNVQRMTRAGGASVRLPMPRAPRKRDKKLVQTSPKTAPR